MNEMQQASVIYCTQEGNEKAWDLNSEAKSACFHHCLEQ